MNAYELFGVAAFRSRQQVLKFDNVLRKSGIQSMIISTPKEISIGCGLSVRFNITDKDMVIHLYKLTKPSSLIGFYKVERVGGRSKLISIPVYSNIP